MKTVGLKLATVGFTIALLSCRPNTPEPAPSAAPAPQPSPAAPAYTAADVHFMSGMITHHAQAVLIAGWAADTVRGASAGIRILSKRIVIGQNDEMALARRWLDERREAVHRMLMPGMLTADQLTALERARGPAFDRLFLTLMIQHHEGALIMVADLFATSGAAQDGLVFRFAADVHADQTTEIDRMRRMLAALIP